MHSTRRVSKYELVICTVLAISTELEYRSTVQRQYQSRLTLWIARAPSNDLNLK